MRKLSQHDAAWIAGFIDGEGHIGINRRKRPNGKYYLRPMLQIGQKKRGPLDWIVHMCGSGDMVRYETRELYNLRFHANSMRELLPQIYPYLRLKNRQAEIVMDFLKRSTVKNNGVALSEKEKEIRTVMWEECRDLNKRGSVNASRI